MEITGPTFLGQLCNFQHIISVHFFIPILKKKTKQKQIKNQRKPVNLKISTVVFCLLRGYYNPNLELACFVLSQNYHSFEELNEGQLEKELSFV